MRAKIKNIPEDNSELQAHRGGYIDPISDSTIEFKGASHENDGIDVSYNGRMVEVEGGETAFKNPDNSLSIMGNMTIPGTNMKFKTFGKKIGKLEEKVTKQENKGYELIDSSDPHDTYQVFSFNTGMVKADAAKQTKASIFKQKQIVANLQNTILDHADATGEDPNDIVANMKNGGYIPIAKDGKRTGKVSRSPDPMNAAIYRAAIANNLDPKLLSSQVDTESGYNTDLVSPKGAMGFAQFMLPTAKQYGLTEKELKSNRPEDLEKVANAQAKYMSDLKGQLGGDDMLAAAAYNGGIGNIKKNLKELARRDRKSVV